MGISTWKPFAYALFLLGAATFLFPRTGTMYRLYRLSQWTDYVAMDSRRNVEKNPGDTEAALLWIQAMRDRGETESAIHVAERLSSLRRDQAGLEQALWELYDEDFNQAGKARIVERELDRNQASSDQIDFLREYYRDHQQWSAFGRLLEWEYDARGPKGSLPWDLITFYEIHQRLDDLEDLYRDHLQSNPHDLNAIEGWIALADYRHDDPQLLTLYAKRAALKPESVEYGLTYAEMLLKMGDRDQAIAELTRVAEQSHPAAPWWERLGDLTWHDGRIPDAQAFYERAYAENPHQGNVARTLGELALRRGDLAQAKMYWQTVLADHPDDREGYLILGDALSKTDPKTASGYYRQGLAIPAKANDQRDDYLRATLLLRTGQKSAAYALLKQIEKQGTGDSADRLSDLSELALEFSEIPQAQGYWARLAKLEPGTDREKSIHARILIAQQRWVEALPLLEELVKKSSTSAGTKGDLAWVYYSLGNYREAEANYQQIYDAEKDEASLRMLREIEVLTHPRLDATVTERAGPSSKEEITSELSYRQPLKAKEWSAAGGIQESYLTRRRTADNSFVDDEVTHPYLKIQGEEARRWKIEAGLHEFLSRAGDHLSPEAEVSVVEGPWSAGARGIYNSAILDPSEALAVDGRENTASLFVRREEGPLAITLSGLRRSFQGAASANTFTGESGLGIDREFMAEGSWRLIKENPFVSLAYTFILSHWDEPFNQAVQLIPWLQNQRAHVGTIYAEEPLGSRMSGRTVALNVSGGRDDARDVWLFNTFGSVSGLIKEAWRWTVGTGWSRDSGASGPGSSWTVQAGFSRLFGTKQ